MNWISPRIWRSASSRFTDDEPLQAADIYTSEVLRDIASQGFDAIWMRGRLSELMRSKIYPELNDPNAQQRIINLKKVIADGKQCGVKLYLFFNEPLSLSRNHDFWKSHPELAGEPHVEPDFDWDELAMCTSTDAFKKFFAESLRHLFDDLTGLGGVILITASESHTHCWSHRSRRKMNDKYLDKCLVDVACPHCRDREPSDVVVELVHAWKQQADLTTPSPKIWAWNWSWSMWYEQPQREVIDKLPEGVQLMCDFERGGSRLQDIGQIPIDEYSLGYAGPSERFLESYQTATKRNLPVSTKLQIGTTHELATVPNLPLIPNLFDKLQKIDQLKLNGMMCSWNFGNSASLNTAAFALFTQRPDLRQNKQAFLQNLAEDYLGVSDTQSIIDAWQLFCDSFSQYPFSIKMLYHSPMNYAVAYPLTLDYRDHPLGPSWIEHEPWGDRIDDCLEPFTIDQACQSFATMEILWSQGLALYTPALNDLKNKNAIEELSCAKMIGCHLSAMRNIFEFHQHRKKIIQQLELSSPCRIPADQRTKELIEQQRQVCYQALELIQHDFRFGYHQEPHAHLYDANKIKSAIE
jgi:hypothetical protein